jgi:hypothetical protein
MPEIAAIDNRPWMPKPIPQWLARELARRKNDIGMSYIKNAGADGTNWDETGNWNTYKGPMTPWVRMCSNGNGKPNVKGAVKSTTEPKDGFILYGGVGFDDAYGFGKDRNKNVLGYEVNGNPHVLQIEKHTDFNYSTKDGRTVPMFLPPPGITSVDVVVKKQLIREATIKWNCFGFAQLEYMTPYFLTPAISAIVEYGWNHFNPESLLDLTIGGSKVYNVLGKNKDGKQALVPFVGEGGKEKLTLRDLWKNGYPLYDCNVRISNGMYDAVIGIITNFEFSTTDGVKYDCITTIGSKHRPYGGVTFGNQQSEDTKNAKKKDTKDQAMTFPEFVEKRFKKIKNCVVDGKNFFDYLDKDEEKFFKDTGFVNHKNSFYGGNAENRVFFSRKADPTSTHKPISDDWDDGDNDESWVTMGFLIELFNFFFTKPSGLESDPSKDFQFYHMNNDGQTTIGANPNLISCDGKILLIPNAASPKYNNGVYFKPDVASYGLTSMYKLDSYDLQELTEGGNPSIFLSSFVKASSIPKSDPSTLSSSQLSDKAIFRIFGTGKKTNNGQETLGIARDDLDKILNRFRYGTINKSTYSNSVSAYGNIGYGSYQAPTNIHSYKKNENILEGKFSFPQYVNDTKTGKERGHWGYLEDLYINVEHVIKLVKESKTTGEFYEKILNSINEAGGGIWDLQIVHGEDYLSIMDQKFVSFEESTEVFQFDIQSAQNIIKSMNFSSTVSNIQANQLISSNTNNQEGNGEVSSTAPLNFVFGDRLFDGKFKKNHSIPNTQVITQLQTPGKNPSTFTMTFINDKKERNVVNLALPSTNKALLTAILADDNLKDNTNVYGSQQPNFNLDLTLQGISGLNTFQLISLKNFPKPYSDSDVIFQIKEVTQTITRDNWETKITAGIRPLSKLNYNKIIYVDGSKLL